MLFLCFLFLLSVFLYVSFLSLNLTSFEMLQLIIHKVIWCLLLRRKTVHSWFQLNINAGFFKCSERTFVLFLKMKFLLMLAGFLAGS